MTLNKPAVTSATSNGGWSLNESSTCFSFFLFPIPDCSPNLSPSRSGSKVQRRHGLQRRELCHRLCSHGGEEILHSAVPEWIFLTYWPNQSFLKSNRASESGPRPLDCVPQWPVVAAWFNRRVPLITSAPLSISPPWMNQRHNGSFNTVTLRISGSSHSAATFTCFSDLFVASWPLHASCHSHRFAHSLDTNGVPRSPNQWHLTRASQAVALGTPAEEKLRFLSASQVPLMPHFHISQDYS